MKKILLIFAISSYFINAQENGNIEIAFSEKEEPQYSGFSLKNSIPPYSLSKINNIISKSIPNFNGLQDEEKTEENELSLAISDKHFSKLSVKEKFTYTMIHPECIQKDALIKDFFTAEKAIIPGYLPGHVKNMIWSERQLSFLKSNRKEVMNLIKETSLKSSFIGLNYKNALEEINAVEMIPFLIEFYKIKDNTDKHILTLLMCLVKNNKYYPFTRSNIYRDLYNNKPVEDSYIDFNEVNEDYIIRTASNFYVQYPKK